MTEKIIASYSLLINISCKNFATGLNWKMTGHTVTLMVLFAMCAGFTVSDVNYYYIVPSQNASCPQQEFCHTLSEIAVNVSQYIGNNSNISIFFQPGNHSLAVELSVATANNFSMVAANVQSRNAALVCIGLSGRFRIRDSTFIQIRGLQFIGCGGNEIVQVTYFILKNATFFW